MPDAAAHCAELVRRADRDRFIATLFAPTERRGALYALYAFNAEIARVRDVAHAPLPGEVRLQWWSDVIDRKRDDEARANPVASALLSAIEQYHLSPAKLIDLIESHRFDLYDEPMARIVDLEEYARKTASALFALAAQILTGTDPRAITEPAGVAYAIAGLVRAFPVHAARRQLYVPLDLMQRHQVRVHDVFAGRSSPGLLTALAELRELANAHLRAMREHLAALPLSAVPALLPVALARFALMQNSRPFAPREIPQWRRQWLIWRAARNPQRIAG
jgi:phytoene synthase